jgi:hypothetical protein
LLRSMHAQYQQKQITVYKKTAEGH